MHKFKIGLCIGFAGIILTVLSFILFDEAVLVRKNTIYNVHTSERVIALTFDDGPSPKWTPLILDELKKAGVKATFFMIGMHAAQYPDVAKRVVAEGHDIGNHTYDHHGIFFYTPQELKEEIGKAEEIIQSVTGTKPSYFRPPKAWITNDEKKQVKAMGYETVLWTLNSKDWVTFDDKYIVKYLLHHIEPGDIILFHDSGGVFGTENGDRHETVNAVARLIEELTRRGYRFVTITELLRLRREGERTHA